MYHLQLETFISVAEAGSFNKAAEELYISAPAVIKQINALESELDLTLFIRTHRGLVLTEAGESFYKDAKYLLQYFKGSVARAKEAAQSGENLIRIGTSLMTPGTFLVDLWPRIHAYLPEAKFKLVSFENTPENAKEIQKNFGQDIDLVVGVFDQAYLDERACAATLLAKEPIRITVPMRHRLAEKESLKIHDLYGEKLMVIHNGWNSSFDLLRHDIQDRYPQIHLETFHFYGVDAYNQCENENCLMLTIDPWQDIHPLMRVLPVEWDYTIPFGILHSPTPSKIVSRFLDAVSHLVKETEKC